MSVDALDRNGVHSDTGAESFAAAVSERADRDDYVRKGAQPG